MARPSLSPPLLLALLLASAALAHAQQAPAPLEAAEQPAAEPAAFARADLDHNGVLDAGEFAAFTGGLKQALGPFLGDGGRPLEFPAAEPAAGANAQTRGARLRAGGVNKFWSGFVSGILTIWATEIGDKTFFIAAILSMKKDRVVVFAGAIGALIVMTVLSVVMGVVATKFLPPSLTHYVGAVLVRSRCFPCCCWLIT